MKNQSKEIHFVNEVEKYRLSLYESIEDIKISDGAKLELVRNTLDGKKYVKLAYHSDKRALFSQLKEIKSKFLPEIIDVFFTDDTIVIEEYIEGKVLSELIDEGNIGKKSVPFIVEDLLSAVEDLHNAGIIHRDIKPGNIIVREDGHAALIDFSIAKLYSPNLSKDTSLFGTVGYAPPEQYGFSQSDFKSDIYAIGITIKEIAERTNNKRYNRLIQRCTEFDPIRRPKSISEVKRIESVGRLPVYIGYITAAVTLLIAVCVAFFNISQFQINKVNIAFDTDNQRKDTINDNKDTGENIILEENETEKITKVHNREDTEKSEKTEFLYNLDDSESENNSYSRIMHIDDGITNYICINVPEDGVIDRIVSISNNLENISMHIEKSDNTITISIGDDYVQTFSYDKSISSTDYNSNGFHSDIILYDLNKDGLYEIIPLIADAYLYDEADSDNRMVMLNGTMAWIVGYDEGFYTASGDIKSVMDKLSVNESTPNCIWGEFPKYYKFENKEIIEYE